MAIGYPKLKSHFSSSTLFLAHLPFITEEGFLGNQVALLIAAWPLDDGNVLDASPAKILDIFLNLAFSDSISGLIDGHLDALVEVGHDN
jgi:hypothetical protein